MSFLNIFNNIKTVLIAIASFLALFGLWKYNNKVEELEEANSKVDLGLKEKQSLKSAIEVKDKVNNQEKSNLKLDSDLKDSEILFNKQKNKEDKEVNDILNNMEDSTSFNLKA